MTKIERGAVTRTANAWDDFRSGTVAAAAAAVPLVGDSMPIMGAIVQNAAASASTIFVGNANRQDFEVVAGASVTVPVCDLSLIYAKTGPGGSATVNWLAGI